MAQQVAQSQEQQFITPHQVLYVSLIWAKSSLPCHSDLSCLAPAFQEAHLFLQRVLQCLLEEGRP